MIRLCSILTLVLLLAQTATILADVDVDEDFESHPVGTPVADLGFFFVTPGYDTTIQQVGVGGSRGISVVTDTGAFSEGLVWNEPGTTQIGDRIRYGVDVRYELGSSGRSNVSFIELSNLGNNAFLVGEVNRVGPDLEYFQLLFVFAGPPFGEAFSEEKHYSEFGLERNSVGELTDWLRLELDVRKFSDGSFDAIFTLSDINGNSLLQANLTGLDLSEAIENELSATFGHNSNPNVIQILYDNLSYNLSTESLTSVSPTGISLIRGVNVGGDISDVLASDDSYLQSIPGFTLNNTEPPVWLEIEGQTTVQNINALRFAVEASTNTPGLTQTIEMFNWTNSKYEQVESGDGTFGEDSVVAALVTRSDFIQAGAVKARCGWRQTGFSLLFPWQISIDQVGWTVFH